jgi:hypothetical protein
LLRALCTLRAHRRKLGLPLTFDAKFMAFRLLRQRHSPSSKRFCLCDFAGWFRSRLRTP